MSGSPRAKIVRPLGLDTGHGRRTIKRIGGKKRGERMSALPLHVQREVRRILDREARRLLDEQMNLDALSASASRGDLDTLDNCADQLAPAL